jgi:preprotein translocase subunit SecY
MSFPILIGQFAKIDWNTTIGKILMCFNQSSWFDLDNPLYTVGVILYIPLTYFFSYFYSMISFNTKDIANNLKKGGSIINGIRPGQPTADYLDKQMKSIQWVGTTMLIIIALLPTLLSGLFNINGLGFGGTTIIIIVGVILEMKNTLNAKTSAVAYKSLVKRRKRG